MFARVPPTLALPLKGGGDGSAIFVALVTGRGDGSAIFFSLPLVGEGLGRG
jgi:hypothetical protein